MKGNIHKTEGRMDVASPLAATVEEKEDQENPMHVELV